MRYEEMELVRFVSRFGPVRIEEAILYASIRWHMGWSRARRMVERLVRRGRLAMINGFLVARR